MSTPAPGVHWSEHLQQTYVSQKEINKNLNQQDFKHQHPVSSKLLDGVNFDVTKAEYFEKFQDDSKRSKKFSLNKNELEVLKKNGFVVSERTGSYSFIDVYLMLYNAHVPVFISLDSMLHAWHSSFDKMLEEAENKFLHPAIVEIVSAIRNGLRKEFSNFNSLSTELKKAIQDVDFFLGVASLILSPVGTPVKKKPKKNNYYYEEPKDEVQPVPPVADTFGVQARIDEVMNAINTEAILSVNLFGKDREEDFSQFKPRGHYDKTEALKRYFKAMMWFGRVNLYIAGKDSQPSELGASLLMLYVLNTTKMVSKWRSFDKLIQIYVGETDSLNFTSLQSLVELADLDLTELFKKPTYSLQLMEDVQQVIMNSPLGTQLINSTITIVDKNGLNLPRAFTFMGQRFTIDNWMHTKVVFGEMKAIRRNPSALDVAYSVFDNNNVTELISERMTRDPSHSNYVNFRDGIPFQVELESSRQAINNIEPSIWKDSIYMLWLDTLREISKVDETFLQNKHVPQFLKTKAWGQKDVETQLASWAQLRHDSLLYVKQGYGAVCCCDYPYGYVDPRVNVWNKFIFMINSMASALKGTYCNSQVNFLQQFASTMQKLATLAEKELNDKPFDEEDTTFIKDMAHKHSIGSGGEYGYKGWYCSLFYNSITAAAEWDPVVADVFTNPPCDMHGDAGAVLLQGVGNINTMYVVADFSNGKQIMYGSPVFSHYEMYTKGVSRMTDGEWRQDIRDQKAPAHPEYTQAYLVPGKNEGSVNYKNPLETGYHQYWDHNYVRRDW
jgi:hypothetical protein